MWRAAQIGIASSLIVLIAGCGGTTDARRLSAVRKDMTPQQVSRVTGMPSNVVGNCWFYAVREQMHSGTSTGHVRVCFRGGRVYHIDPLLHF